jgi:hypothetical protein
MVAQMYFTKRASAEAKAIDTQISYDKEPIAQLVARTSGLPLVWATHLLEALSHTRSFLLFLVFLGTIYIGLQLYFGLVWDVMARHCMYALYMRNSSI